MLSFSNEELDAMPLASGTVKCKHCGDTHEITYSDLITKDPDGNELRHPSDQIGFYKCGEKSYLAVINGKLVD